jgi:hypothetical protein
MQAGTGGEHPAGEDALHLALQGHLIDLDESVGVRRLFRRASVAGAGGELQRAELHGLADVHREVDDAAGDLIETGELRGRMHDALRRRSNDLVIGRRWRRWRGRGGRRARRCAGSARRRQAVRPRNRTGLHAASRRRIVRRRIVLRRLLRRRWILARRLRCPTPPARADISARDLARRTRWRIAEDEPELRQRSAGPEGDDPRDQDGSQGRLGENRLGHGLSAPQFAPSCETPLTRGIRRGKGAYARPFIPGVRNSRRHHRMRGDALHDGR